MALTVLLLLPLAAGAPAPPAAKPTGALTPIQATTANTAGCHSIARFPRAPVADPRSATIAFDGHAQARGCQIALAYAIAFATLGFEGSNFTVARSGTYYADFRWSLPYHVGLRANGTNGSATAIAAIFVVGLIYDWTNASYVGGVGSDTFALFEEIHAGAYDRDRLRDAVTLNVTVGLVTGHVYAFTTWVEFDAESEIRTTGDSAANLELGPASSRAALDSFVLAP